MLRRFVEAGYGKRVMFGSDQMIWPETIELAIESIESADLLTSEVGVRANGVRDGHRGTLRF
jgi:predicted TIM-barrel fold metal-dependent hydrolase